MIQVAILFCAAAIAAWMAFGSVSWAIWNARRTWRRGFSLSQLLFSFTIATLLIGAVSAWLHLFAN
jgi:hypothetical protein